MKVLKTLIINIIFLYLFFSIIELIYRFTKGIKNNNLPVVLKTISKDKSYGMYRFDDVLGYSPTPNFKGVINEPLKRWENVQVTILEDSNRLSFQESFKQNYLKNKPFTFITTGDSFTFGDQVSNSETWQSCLNNKESQHFYINSGVGGYGILQPIMRAKSLLNIYKEDSDTYGIILSVLVGHTARRTCWIFVADFQNPAY